MSDFFFVFLLLSFFLVLLHHSATSLVSSPGCRSWWRCIPTHSWCAWPQTSSWQPSSRSCPVTEGSLSTCYPSHFSQEDREEKQNVWWSRSSSRSTEVFVASYFNKRRLCGYCWKWTVGKHLSTHRTCWVDCSRSTSYLAILIKNAYVHCIFPYNTSYDLLCKNLERYL